MIDPEAKQPAIGRIPLSAWPSLLSLDAVFVAVAWQQLLMRSFCHRPATWAEAVALAATVWLIYVADRLLDAARLDLAKPHTLRHWFYLKYRPTFLGLWILVLVVNTAIVVQYLPADLLRGGLLLASAVLIYGASVHFSPASLDKIACESRFRRLGNRLPKEIRVGILFAFGVSLTAWTELVGVQASYNQLTSNLSTWYALSSTTLLMAILFSCNCILVARFERKLDWAQSFASYNTHGKWPTEYTGSIGRTATKVVVVTLVPILLTQLHLPASMLMTLVSCAIGLSLSMMLPNRPWIAPAATNAQTTFDARGAWVDTVLWAPPTMMLCLT